MGCYPLCEKFQRKFQKSKQIVLIEHKTIKGERYFNFVLDVIRCCAFEPCGEGAIEMEEQNISEQDVLLSIEILKKALEYRPQIKKAILGDELQALPPDEKANELFSPRVAIQYIGEAGNIPSLYFRFMGAEAPVVEASFYPIEAVYSFLTEARAYARWVSKPEVSEEEIEKIAFDRAIDITLIMIDNFYRRADLMMDSFIYEVKAQWRIENRQRTIQYHAERGNILDKRKDPTLENLLKIYTKDVLQLWKYQGQTEENWRKLSLAEEYDAIYRHWKRLSRMLSEDDWREYAKAGKFQDAPDDLLDKLLNADRLDDATTDNRLSELAIEHAARRVRLIKKHGVNESVIKLRQKGIRVTGYTSTQLFSFLKEGRELKERVKAAQGNPAQERTPVSVEQNSGSAQIKKAKSFKQKLKFVEEKIGGSVEQNGSSAQEEKS